MSTRFIAVTMSRDNFIFLIRGKDGKGGLKDKKGVIRYLNDVGGFLGEVVDIKIED